MKPTLGEQIASVLLATTVGVALAVALFHWLTCEGMC